jgi:hypothetical protein
LTRATSSCATLLGDLKSLVITNIFVDILPCVVLKCQNSAIFFITSDLAKSNEAANATGINQDGAIINCVKETRESKFPGSVTYIQENKAYRASIDNFGKIQQSVIFVFGSSFSTADFLDMIVHDDFVIVRKDGDTYLSFIRPKPEG